MYQGKTGKLWRKCLLTVFKDHKHFTNKHHSLGHYCQAQVTTLATFKIHCKFRYQKFFLLTMVTQNGHSLDCCSGSDPFQGFLKQLSKLAEVGSTWFHIMLAKQKIPQYFLINWHGCISLCRWFLLECSFFWSTAN